MSNVLLVTGTAPRRYSEDEGRGRMPDMLIGTVSHYYGRIGVAALELDAPLRTGDRVHIQGHTTDLKQRVNSIQIDQRKIDAAESGDDIAIEVEGKVRTGDRVCREMEGEAATGP